MKAWKRWISMLLVFVMVLSNSSLSAFASETSTSTSGSMEGDAIDVEGEGTVGTLLSETLSEEIDRQQQEAYIKSITIENGKAFVEYLTNVDSELVVAVYTEDKQKLVSYAKTEVAACTEDSTVEVELSVTELPQYFYAAASLLDPETHMAICDSYTTSLYTEGIQTVRNSTPEDYDADRVVVLDDGSANESGNSSFAVYREETVAFTETEGSNELEDLGNGKWRFSNADDTIKNLSKGEVVSYTYEDGFLDAFQVETVVVSGDTVTIIEGEQVGLLDIFECVKIQVTSYEDVDIDTTTMEEGMVYEGSSAAENPVTYGLKTASADELDLVESDWFHFSIDKTIAGSKNATSGIGDQTNSVRVILGASLKFDFNDTEIILDDENEYVSTGTDYEAKISLEIKGACEPEFPMATFLFTAIPGVRFSVQPVFVASISASIKVSGGFSGTLGQEYAGEVKSRCSFNGFTPAELEVEGKAFVGFELKITAALLSVKLASVELDAKIGPELSATATAYTDTGEAKKKHSCDLCLDISFHMIAQVDVDLFLVKVLDHLNTTLVKMKLKGPAYYWSKTYGDWGKGSCPHDIYKVTLLATKDKEDSKEAVPEASVDIKLLQADLPESGVETKSEYPDAMQTDSTGYMTAYLAAGDYEVTVTKDNITANTEFTVEKAAKNITLNLEEKKYSITLKAVNDEGTALADTSVSITSEEIEMEALNGTTDLLGKYTAKLLPGTYQVEMKNGDKEKKFPMVVTDQNEERTIKLLGPTYKVTLNIVNESGEPVESAGVYGTELPEVPFSDANGVAELYLEDGSYELEVLASGLRGNAAVTVAGAEQEITCTLYSAQEVTVTVKDSKGNLIENALITVVSSSTEEVENEYVYSNADGVGVLHLAPGSYTFSAAVGELEGSTTYTVGTSAGTVQITLSEKLYPVNISTYCNITVYDEDGSLCHNSSTDGDGFVANLPKGRYLIDVYPSSGYGTTAFYIDWIDVSSEVEKTIECDTRTVNCSVSGSCLTITGKGFIKASDVEAYNNSSITSIVVGDGFKKIEAGVFNDFSYVESITLPSSLLILGGCNGFGFSGCSSLESLTIPSGVVPVFPLRLSECTNLKSLTLLNKNLYEKIYVDGCDNLTEVIISNCDVVPGVFSGDGVENVKTVKILGGETIGYHAFEDWMNLKTIELPDSLTNILSYAFKGCTSLEEIVIPKQVESIGAEAFYDCISLKNVILPEKIETLNVSVFAGCSALESIQIPESVTKISERAFAVTGFTEFTVPDTVKTVDYTAFAGCKKLKKLVCPQKSSENFDLSELHITSLEELVVNAKTIENCSQEGLVSVTFLENVDIIWSGALRDNPDLVNLVFPEHLSNIGEDQFTNCTSLKELIMPGSLDYTFNVLGTLGIPDNLETLVISEGITRIYAGDFKDHPSLRKLVLPSSMKSILGGAVTNCASLEEVVFQEGLESIGIEAFKNCTSLKEVIIPESVKEIGYDAFMGCTSLKKAVVPNAQTYFKDEGTNGTFSVSWTFDECTALESITVGTSTVHAGDSDYHMWPNLKEMNFLGTVKKITSLSNLVVGELIIPDSVTELCSISNCDNLKKVTLSKSLTTLSGFYGCDALESFEIPEHIKTIGKEAFAYCRGLKEIQIPENVSTVNAGAFEGCIGLTYFEWPDYINKIPDRAFRNCSNLEEISIPEGVEYIGQDVFVECDNLKSVVLPESLRSLYRTALAKSELEVIVFKRNLEKQGIDFWAAAADYDIYGGLDSEDYKDMIIYYPEGAVIFTDSVKERLFMDQATWFTYDPSIFEDEEISLLSLEAASYDENVNALSAETSGSEEENKQSVTYTNLVEDTNYVFAVVKDSTAEDLFSTENVMYFMQGKADEDGNLSFTYLLNQEEEGEVVFFGIEKTDLSSSNVTVSPMTYTGNEQKPDIQVILGELTLIEGEDYVLEGATTVVDAGEYKVTVKGIGIYGGSIPLTYTVNKVEQKLKVNLEDNTIEVGESSNITVESAKGDVSYVSRNPEVVSVDENGLINALDVGVSVIVVTASGDNNHMAARKLLYIMVVPPSDLEDGEDSSEDTEDEGTTNDGNTDDEITNSGSTGTGDKTDEGFEWIEDSVGDDYEDEEKTENIIAEVNGAIYEKGDINTGEIVYCKPVNKGRTSLTIPDTVTIQGKKFKVTAIADNAFKNNKKLKKLKIGKNVKTIGKNAFSGCKSLTTVTGGKNLVTIKQNAFANCTKLKTVSITSKKLKTIGKRAFYKCKKLTKVTLKTTKLTKKTIGSQAFKGIKANCTFKVPKSKVKAYKTLFKAKGAGKKIKVKK